MSIKHKMAPPSTPEINVLGKTYPAKVILFGEYTVLLGAKALAVPSHEFYAVWKKDEAPWELPKTFLDHLVQVATKHGAPFDKARFGQDIDEGWRVDPNFPLGYGLGSSGTLCAAIMDRYFSIEDSGLLIKKEILKAMESFFHGESSGIDPLVSYFAKPLLVEGDGLSILEGNVEVDFEMIDSKVPRKTDVLVRTFLDRYDSDPAYTQGVRQLITIQDNIISSLMAHKAVSRQELLDFGRLHLEIFADRFPEKLLVESKKALREERFIIKLCGSGGGGYFLKIKLPPS